MSLLQEQAPGQRPAGNRTAVARVGRRALSALEQLAGGLGTALFALVLLLWSGVVAVLCPLGIGLLLVPSTLGGVRLLADRERARLSRWGPEVLTPGPVPGSVRAALADPAVGRKLGWLGVHATPGLLLGLLGVLLPLYALRDGSYPLWWQAVPDDVAVGSTPGGPWWWRVDSWPSALAVALLGLGWAALTVGATPGMARLQAAVGRRLLAPPPGADLSLRVAQLTATRAAALDAHVTELRRIERSLHDGTQNRLVGVTVLLGAARRSLSRDPTAAEALLERAQSAAEEALAELRSVARGILPPVLVDRGLAAACPVPCRVDVDVADRCPASVEATAYFVVAEALTNIAKHSGAGGVRVAVHRQAGTLHLSVVDDGVGGAAEAGGSGLRGIRRRVEAHDGTLTLTSPPGGPTTVEVRLPCRS